MTKMLTLSLEKAKCLLKENKTSISFYIMHSMPPINLFHDLSFPGTSYLYYF